jgi:hypothetical protein
VTRTGADSTVAAYLPEGMDIYLGYVDGNFRSYDQIKARFPGKLVVPIATQASGNVGIVGDGPPDNGTWPEWVAWVQRRRKAGVDPTINTNSSTWPAAVKAFNDAGVAQPHWWIAKWDDHPEVISGTIGKQYKSVPQRYDLSLFADYWPGVDPKPAAGGGGGTGGTTTGTGSGTGTSTTTRRVKNMLLIYVIASGGQNPGIWLLSGALYVHMTSPADVTALGDAGVPTAHLTLAQHDAFLTAYKALTTPPGPGEIITSTV